MANTATISSSRCPTCVNMFWLKSIVCIFACGCSPAALSTTSKLPLLEAADQERNGLIGIAFNLGAGKKKKKRLLRLFVSDLTDESWKHQKHNLDSWLKMKIKKAVRNSASGRPWACELYHLPILVVQPTDYVEFPRSLNRYSSILLTSWTVKP